MKASHLVDLDLNIARARILLAPATLLSVYLDSATPDLTPWFRLTGGLLEIDRYALAILLLHLSYSVATHSVTSLRPTGRRFGSITAAIDILFAVAIAVFTVGPTSPAYAFFAFAIIAVGCREGFQATLAVTLCSMVSYFVLIVVSADGEARDYLMRPVYLAITGYLIGFLGQQRVNFETRVRELETREERHSIARRLHDGYIQALAAVNLRIIGCRQLLEKGSVDHALAELAALEAGVAREYDEVRSYIRSLTDLDGTTPATSDNTRTWFRVQADFRTRGLRAEQILLILIESVRNTIQHANADAAVIQTSGTGDTLRITIRDDGIGFPAGGAPPWSIASRVAELGGDLRMVGDHEPGAHLEIELPAA
jgi:signal transduction histidine kinase